MAPVFVFHKNQLEGKSFHFSRARKNGEGVSNKRRSPCQLNPSSQFRYSISLAFIRHFACKRERWFELLHETFFLYNFVFAKVSTAMSSPIDQEVAAIRGEEKSKGGLSYEVILAEPVSDRPPSPLTVSTPTRPQPSEEEIERKLLAAKERREANRSINDVDEKINQAVQKRQEIVSTFVTKTKENLDAKMEESQEKREAHLNSLKTKLKEHLERVETVRVTNDTKLQEIQKQIDEKLKSADEKRDEIIKQLQEKLRLHEEHIKSVKQSSEEKTKAMEEQIHSKIQLAAEKREEIEKEMLEKLKEQDRRGELARQKKENRLSGGGQCDEGETASSG